MTNNWKALEFHSTCMSLKVRNTVRDRANDNRSGDFDRQEDNGRKPSDHQLKTSKVWWGLTIFQKRADVREGLKGFCRENTNLKTFRLVTVD